MGLAGKVVLNTRPKDPFGDSDTLAGLLADAGAKVINHPVIGLKPAVLDQNRLEILSNLNKFEWLVFVSRMGVRFFEQLLVGQGLELASIGNRIAVIGEATAEPLRSLGIEPDLIAKSATSEGLGSELVRDTNGTCFLVRASRGSQVLGEMLSDAGRKYVEFVAYESYDVKEASQEVADTLSNEEVDWVVLTSASGADSSCRLFGDLLRTTRVAAISSEVANVISEKCSVDAAAIARRPSFASLVEAMDFAGD